MKYLLLVISVLLLTTVAEAGVVYEKVSDGIAKITTTETVETVDQTTITDLKIQREALVAQKARAITSHAATIVDLDARIATIDNTIIEIKKVGVKEITEELNIL